jgi:hypothetical protein
MVMILKRELQCPLTEHWTIQMTVAELLITALVGVAASAVHRADFFVGS